MATPSNSLLYSVVRNTAGNQPGYLCENGTVAPLYQSPQGYLQVQQTIPPEVSKGKNWITTNDGGLYNGIFSESQSIDSPTVVYNINYGSQWLIRNLCWNISGWFMPGASATQSIVCTFVVESFDIYQPLNPGAVVYQVIGIPIYDPALPNRNFNCQVNLVNVNILCATDIENANLGLRYRFASQGWVGNMYMWYNVNAQLAPVSPLDLRYNNL